MDISDIKTEQDLLKALKGHTAFERAVYLTTFKIPKGKVSTYSRIAKKIGHPKAFRAVANTLNKCPLWPVVPCHRVVASDGRFTGNEKGASHRRKLIRDEGVPIKGGKVVLTDDVLF
jgi:O-6-methylguanine DNA methyltransferase